MRQRLLVGLALVATIGGCGPFGSDEPRSPSVDASGDGSSRLVDVNGRALFLHCTGVGRPTVVLDGGIDETYRTWSAVQARASRYTRVCSYNRAGLPPSRRGRSPRTGERLVNELHALLRAASVPGPYLLVGASFGGLNGLIFADRYRDETAGLVLVNSLHPDFDRDLDQMLPRDVAADRKHATRPTAEGIRLRDIFATERQAASVRDLGALPLLVLEGPVPFMGVPGISDRLSSMWSTLQEDLASLSSQGRRENVPGVTPDLVQSSPQQIDRAIHRVVQMVAAG